MEYVSPRGRDAGKKAQAFGLFVKSHGWQGKWNKDDVTGITHLFCRRGENETIDVWWDPEGRIVPGMEPVYTLAGERIRQRNLSAASKIVTARPDPDRLRKAARKRKRQTGIDFDGDATASAEAIGELRGSLPFDSESDDDELEAVLHRRNIVWINRLTGQADSAFVNADKQFDVVRLDGDRDQIHFCDAARGGYRAVYLNSIVSVG